MTRRLNDLDDIRKFIPKDIDSNECWNWTGSKTRGYGKITINYKSYRAHRVVAALYFNFPLNSNLLVLHKCNNPSCVNPNHLYISNQKDNMQDAVYSSRNKESRKTHCIRGHELTEDNIYRYNTHRYCKTCMQIRKEQK